LPAAVRIAALAWLKPLARLLPCRYPDRSTGMTAGAHFRDQDRWRGTDASRRSWYRARGRAIEPV